MTKTPPSPASTRAQEPATATRASAPALAREVLRTTGEPLETETRALFESRFGHDFSRVRVHADARAAASADALHARAYAHGRHIVMGAGGQADHALLAHELAHTVQ